MIILITGQVNGIVKVVSLSGGKRMFKSRCYNGGDKHKFKERHNSKVSTHAQGEAPDYTEYEYIYDICVWCGKVIKYESKE
jgi:hypothetical protein